jgi:hypothetical protein
MHLQVELGELLVYIDAWVLLSHFIDGHEDKKHDERSCFVEDLICHILHPNWFAWK